MRDANGSPWDAKSASGPPATTSSVFAVVTTDTFITFRARTSTIASEPDHFKRAANDFAKLSRDGRYHNYFPSLHLAYDILTNLKARASISKSYGRPGLASLVSSPTVSDVARTVTMGNPDLRPQIADNIDLKLEYYFGSTGMVSVRGYRKNIKEDRKSTRLNSSHRT